MAEAVAGNLVINVLANIDKFTKSIDKVKEELKNAGTTITAFGVATAGGFGFAIKAAGDQEHATAKLVAALKNYGRATQDNIDDLTKYASTMMELTGVADEVITDNQAILASFGMNTAEIKKATEAALNYAATGNDLSGGVMLLGRAFTGHTETLAKMGIEIAEGTSKSEKFNAVLKAFEGHFGGQAQAQRKTFLGQMNAVKNTLGELAEDVGFILLPFAQRAAEILQKAIKILQNINPHVLAFSVGIGAVATGLALIGGPLLLLIAQLPTIIASVKVLVTILSSGGGIIAILGLVALGITLIITNWEKFKAMGVAVINFHIRMLNELIDLINKYLIPVINAVQTTLGLGSMQAIRHFKEVKLEIENTSGATKDTLIADSGIVVNNFNENEDAKTAKHREEWDKRIVDAQKGHEYLKTFSQELRLRLEEDSVSWTTIFVDGVIQLKDAFASGIADMITSGKSFKDVMEQIGKDIVNYFIEAVVKRMVDAFLLNFDFMSKRAPSLLAPSLLFKDVPTQNEIDIRREQLRPQPPTTDKPFTPPEGFVESVGYIAKKMVDATVTNVKNLAKKIKKKVKKIFSGGVLGEPSIITGLRSGAQAIAGEDGPEALVSFRDDLGITPREGRRRLFGFPPRPGLTTTGNGGESITVNIYGQFLEADNAKWDKLVREKIVIPLQRYRKKTAGSLI